MTMVTAGITTSLDGYITGPNDRPGIGLGEGGERLHYWVFGGPWSYDEDPKGEATGADKEFLDDVFARVGAGAGAAGSDKAGRRPAHLAHLIRRSYWLATVRPRPRYYFPPS